MVHVVPIKNLNHTIFALLFFLALASLHAAASPKPAPSGIPLAPAVEDSTDLADDEVSEKCALQGLKEGRLTIEELDADVKICLYDGTKRKACATSKNLPYNSAKSVVTCKKDTVEVWSEQGFSAASSTLVLKWQKGELSVKGSTIDDPSATTVQGAERLLSQGRISEAAAEFRQVLYPTNYFRSEDVWVRLLLKSHPIAGKLGRKSKWEAAAGIMAPAVQFDDVANMLKSKEAQGQKAKVTLALNDYGYFLDESGKHPEAEIILKHVVGFEPERTVAYLNLGDCLFAQKKDADGIYREYAKRTPKKDWAARIVERCPSCTGL